MILKGDKIFEYLSSQIIQKSDPSESSHWRKYHADFKFTGDGFSGLSGFGGCEPPYKGLKFIFHSLFQTPYRKIGAKYNSFITLDEIAKKITTKQSRAYDLDVLRQVITLSMLSQRLGKSHSNTLVIGDGFSSMSSLINLSGFSKNLILINLSKTLFVDLWYLRMILGNEHFNEKVFLTTALEDLSNYKSDIHNRGNIIAIEARNQHFIRELSIDVAINIASMQEMHISTVNKYIADMRYSLRNSKNDYLLFYCCNRIEKKLPEGEITRIGDYGWSKEDEFIIDELCSWHQKYYSTKPPFYNPYDGPILHKLVKLKMI